MVKWVLFLISLVGFALMYGTSSPVVVFLGLILGLGALVAGIFKWMDERVGEVTRTQAYVPTADEAQVLKRMHEKRINAIKAASAQARDSSNTP
jgi:hypothetical protein